jgi:hypothetical protein
VLHEPVYTLGSVHHVEDHFAALQEPLVDLGVDAALAGHAHLYEHFLFGATHFVTIGGGGAELHEAAAQAQELPEVAKHLVKTKSDYEYLIVDFSLDRARFTVYTEDGRSVLDEWTIEKPREQ